MTFALFCLAFVMVLLALRIFGGWFSSGTLVEYQRGVVFRRGIPVRDVGPGRYRVWTGIEKIMIVDTRPVQVNYENRGVMLSDGASAMYSVSGSARVDDVRKAVYAAANYNNVPSFVMLCCTRFVLNNCTSAEITANKDTVAEQIISRAKPRLAAAGFELISFRLPELSVTQLRTTE
ncbi:MAG: SPFH domain-containing protein [Candidatus Acidiferrales bacterium]